MPRKKATDEPMMGETLMLPAPSPIRTGGHKHEHDIDPYSTAPGPVPGRTSKMRTTESEPKKNPTQKDLAERDYRKDEQKMLAHRYNRYLDMLTKHGGDRLAAIAETMNLPVDESEPKIAELHAEICRGIWHTDIAEVLIQHDLGINAVAARLSYWMYSDNAAASLNSIKLRNELAGDTNAAEPFEIFLRLHKEGARLRKGPR